MNYILSCAFINDFYAASRVSTYPGAVDQKEVMEIKNAVRSTVLDLVENQGVTEFRVKNVTAFDRWFAFMIIDLKNTYGNIRLETVTPYIGYDSEIDEEQRLDWESVCMECDRDVVFQKDCTPNVLLDIDVDMAKNSDIIISIWDTDVPSEHAISVAMALAKGAEVHIVNPKTGKMSVMSCG